MNAQTYYSRKQVLKERWGNQTMNRQLVTGYSTFGSPPYHIGSIPIVLNPSESLIKNQRVKLEEMNQRLARLQRKGKPSYRQRQRNGRKARHG